MEKNLDLNRAQEEIDFNIKNIKGKKVSEIKKILNMTEVNNKASFVVLARKILKITNNQFLLCDGSIEAVLKTVRLTGNNKPAESMSFMPIDFNEWVSVSDWNSSSLYKYFKEKTLVLFIFQQYPIGNRVADDEMTFLDVKLWKMSEYDLNHGLKEVWDEVRYLIIENKLEIIPHQRKNDVIFKNNLPSSKFNELGHLRPGGKNGQDKIELPTGQKIVKQRFWFNVSYVQEIINI